MAEGGLPDQQGTAGGMQAEPRAAGRAGRESPSSPGEGAGSQSLWPELWPQLPFTGCASTHVNSDLVT
jgi:hypothetical protein